MIFVHIAPLPNFRQGRFPCGQSREKSRRLAGYVCKADTTELSHAEIADILARLGVRGKEPEQALALNAPDTKRDRQEPSTR